MAQTAWDLAMHRRASQQNSIGKLERAAVLAIYFLLFFCSSRAPGQTGLKTGIVLSGIYHSHEDFRPFLGYESGWIQYGESRPLLGIAAGIYRQTEIRKDLYLNVEILFSQKGYIFDHTPLYNSNYRISILYLELPVFLRWTLPVSWRLQPGITAGAYAAYNLHSKRRVRQWDHSNSRGLQTVNAVDYGFLIGVSLSHRIFNRSWVWGFRLNYGLAGILSPVDGTSLYDDPGTNRILSFMVSLGTDI